MKTIKRFKNLSSNIIITLVGFLIFTSTAFAGTDSTKTIRINCGGPKLEYHGVVFEADKWYTGTYKYANPSIWDIYETTYDELYMTERASDNDLGMFSYNIPVQPGDYTVCLHFAEIYWNCPGGQPGGPGSRIFNVDIEGSRVLGSYDIIADVGCRTAVVKKFEVKILDDTLNIIFKPTVNRPKISAIEIVSKSGGETPLSVKPELIDNELPGTFELKQNYPNPFNPTTNIRFAILNAGMVKLTVYNSLGKEIQQLINEFKNPGTYEVTFDAGSNDNKITSGVYYYRLETGDFSETRRMVLLK
jgi:hypothetical protein